MDPVEIVVLLAIVLLIIMALYSNRGRRRRPTPSVVVIQEGRFPGEAKDGVVCPRCGRRFKHIITVDEELLKCPYCGSEIE